MCVSRDLMVMVMVKGGWMGRDKWERVKGRERMEVTFPADHFVAVVF